MNRSSSKANNSRSATLRSRLQHPVVDADGHTVEFEPGVLNYLRDIAGDKAVDQYKSAPTIRCGRNVLSSRSRRHSI
jgi:hypothetical protein